MITLLVCRHGETDFNVQGRYAGSTDVPLNENGLRQAHELARDSRVGHVDVIISSPLRRALETARIVQDEIGKPLHIVREFSERCVGVYEGLTRDEAREHYPELWATNSTSQLDFAPTGGETIRQVSRRIAEGMSRICEAYDGMTVLLVAHAFVAREINRSCRGLPSDGMFGFTLGNGEVVEFSLGVSVLPA